MKFLKNFYDFVQKVGFRGHFLEFQKKIAKKRLLPKKLGQKNKIPDFLWEAVQLSNFCWWVHCQPEKLQDARIWSKSRLFPSAGLRSADRRQPAPERHAVHATLKIAYDYIACQYIRANWENLSPDQL